MWGRKPIFDRILERIWRRLLAKKDHESVPLLFGPYWNLINEQVWVLALAGCVAVLCFLGNALHSHILPISTQVYNWVPANLMLEVNPIGLTSHPGIACSRRSNRKTWANKLTRGERPNLPSFHPSFTFCVRCEQFLTRSTPTKRVDQATAGERRNILTNFLRHKPDEACAFLATWLGRRL